MSGIAFDVDHVLGPATAGDADSYTIAPLRITVKTASETVPITEVYDGSSLTVRQHVNVPLYSVGLWLLANWWRMRWEPRRSGPEWRLVHSMASIGKGYAWPSIEICGLGEFVHVQSFKDVPEQAGLRFLRNVIADVPAADFELAVDRLVDQVQGRLSGCGFRGQEFEDLQELQKELRDERSDEKLALECRLQATAGIDPGDAPETWLDDIRNLGTETGPASLEEVLAVLPDMSGLPANARKAVQEIRESKLEIDLSWLAPPDADSTTGKTPWQVGVSLAGEFRVRQGLNASDPVEDDFFRDRLKIELPIKSPVRRYEQRPLAGGYRTSGNQTRTKLFVPTQRLNSQRFFLARALGCAQILSQEDNLLPVTTACTGVQQTSRAFARELLCPWRALDAFTEEHGTDEEGIVAAAEFFQVSELTVQNTLVDYRKLPRDRKLQE